jgi:hypothetical protein
MISRQVFFMIDDGPKDYGNFDFWSSKFSNPKAMVDSAFQRDSKVMLANLHLLWRWE